MGLKDAEVLFLCAGGGRGGMEHVVLTLARNLAGNGWKTHVILPDDEGADDTLGWLREANVSAQVHPALRHSFRRRTFRHLTALWTLVRSSPAPVVNLHYCLNYVPQNDLWAVRLAGRRSIVSLHTADTLDACADQRLIRKNRTGTRLCQGVVVVCRFQQRQMLMGDAPADRVHVIPCGVAAGQKTSRREARRRWNLPPDAFVVASAGRLVPDKGMAELIRALAQIPVSGQAPHLLIAGEGQERSRLECLAAEHLPGRCHFLGHLGEMSQFYQAADVFALASRCEAFGLVYAEAARHGLPAIGTEAGGIPEVVLHERTGLLVPPRDPDRLAEALQRLRDDPRTCRRLGAAGQARAEAEFTESLMVSRYEALLWP